MRKIDRSGNTEVTTSFNRRAEARSRPKGFSTTTLPPAHPTRARCWITVSNSEGGIAR